MLVYRTARGSYIVETLIDKQVFRRSYTSIKDAKRTVARLTSENPKTRFALRVWGIAWETEQNA